MDRRRLTALARIVIVLAVSAWAAAPAAAQDPQPDVSSLAKTTQNPVGDLITVPMQFNFNGGGDLAPALDLDGHPAAVRVPAQQVDGADRGHVLPAYEDETGLDLAGMGGQQFLQLRLHGVLGQPRFRPEGHLVVEGHLA